MKIYFSWQFRSYKYLKYKNYLICLTVYLVHHEIVIKSETINDRIIISLHQVHPELLPLDRWCGGVDARIRRRVDG